MLIQSCSYLAVLAAFAFVTLSLGRFTLYQCHSLPEVPLLSSKRPIVYIGAS